MLIKKSVIRHSGFLFLSVYCLFEAGAAFANTDASGIAVENNPQASALADDGQQVNGANAASEKLTAFLGNISSMKGQFEQTLYSKKGLVVQKNSGDFLLKKPGYFLWESKAPYAQIIVGSPNKLWVYDPDLEQVTIRNQDPTQDNNPAQILSGDISHLAQQYNVVSTEESDKTTFLLQPREGAVITFQDIAFTFNANRLDQLSFKDGLGQTTTLVLQDTQVNIPVDKAVFEFNAPEGTDIIIDNE